MIVADGDFHGDGVNLAVRLQSLAELGGLCISAKVYEEVAGKVAARFNDLGTRAVKGFERPVHVYRVSSGALARRPRAMLNCARAKPSACAPL